MLTTAGAPSATTLVAGDICPHAPWGNLAVFYRGGVTSPGLVRLGCLTDGGQVLRSPDPLDVTIVAAGSLRTESIEAKRAKTEERVVLPTSPE